MSDDTPEPAAPDSPDESAAPSGARLDVRRLIAVIALCVGGVAYFFWDDIRDVVKPPVIVGLGRPVAELRQTHPDLIKNHPEVLQLPVPDAALTDDAQFELEVQRRDGTLGVTFTRVGAAVTRIVWRKKGDEHVETLVGQEEVPNRAFVVELPGSEDWSTQEFRVVEKTAHKVVFSRTADGGRLTLTKTFTLRSDRPVIDLEVNIESLEPSDWVLDKGYDLIVSNSVGEPPEHDKDECTISVRSNHVTDHHAVRRLSGARAWPSKEERRRAGHGPRGAPPTLEWVATTNRYFGLIVRPEEPLFDAKMLFTRTAECAAAVTLHVPPPRAVLPGSRVRQRFHVYAGPKDYEVLASLPGRQQEAIDLYFGRAAIFVLEWIYERTVRNYGVAIILMTVLFRLLMWPVTWVNLKSMVDLKRANAELEKIDAREPPRSQIEARAAWLKEARVWEKVQSRATLGVLLPLLILLPVLLMLYYALSTGYEFYRQPLGLWIDDISKRDPYFVLPVLMGLGMMGQLRAISPNPSRERSWLLMPIAFTLIFAFFSAGLVLFWLADTLVGWGQVAIIQRRRGRRAEGAAS
jgi:YidC/Oxa1 family membrane protein insertase